MAATTPLPSALLHLATLELVAAAAPFSHARSLPLRLLSDLLADYLQLLASHAKLNAEHAGRHRVALWDLARALDDLGVGSLSDLREEARKALPVQGPRSDDADRLARLAGGLAPLLAVEQPEEPVARLRYDPLTWDELAALHDLHPPPGDDADAAPADDGASDASDTDSHEAKTPSASSPLLLGPASPTLSPFRVKAEEDQYTHLLFPVVPFDAQIPTVPPPLSAWRDPTAIPPYVPAFLPPFPGMERQLDAPEPLRRRRDRERDADEEAQWDAPTVATSVDPWLTPIPFAASSIAEVALVPSLPALSPPPSPTGRRKQRRPSLSAPIHSSLPAYRAAVAETPAALTWLRPNPKRRAAASAISIPPDNSLADDSLFGSIPVPLVRSVALTPGFLPDGAPPKIHPFNTNLPHTVATAVPAHPAPHPALIAPPQHPRIPSVISSVRAQLAQPTSPHLQLFSRLTRIGPPGPLGPKGEALDYEYVGVTAVLAPNVDWPQHLHNARLPQQKDREDGAETGIKLSLRLGASGSARGSPAPYATPTPGPWLGGASPSASTSMMTPGPWLTGGTPLTREFSTDRGASFVGSPVPMSPAFTTMAPVAGPSLETAQQPDPFTVFAFPFSVSSPPTSVVHAVSTYPQTPVEGGDRLGADEASGLLPASEERVAEPNQEVSLGVAEPEIAANGAAA